MKFTQIRNATALIEYHGTTFLIDPYLSPKDFYPPFPGCYHPNKRHPMVEHPIPESPPEVRIKNLLIWLEENLDQSHSIDSLSHAVRVSPRTFSRHFKHITGETLTEWLTRKRLNQARLLLESTALRIGDIGYRTEFKEIGVFRKAFLKRFGKSPRNWRKEFQK